MSLKLQHDQNHENISKTVTVHLLVSALADHVFVDDLCDVTQQNDSIVV